MAIANLSKVSPRLISLRVGYRLTEEAEAAIDVYYESGCYCHTGCAPCGRCEHGCSLKTAYEIDEFWEVDSLYQEEEEMSREQIVDKSTKKEFKVGKWYQCRNSCQDMEEGKYYQIIRLNNEGDEAGFYLDTGGFRGEQHWYLTRLDINSECDFDPINFKPEDVIVKVAGREVSGWAEEKVATKITLPKARVAGDSDIMLGWDLVNKHFNILNTTKEESNMSIQRKVVNVKLIDNDQGLDIQYALVHDFGEIVTEDDNATTIQELILNNDVADLLAIHNEIRRDQVDLEILQRTGNSVNLRDKKLKDLTWIIK